MRTGLNHAGRPAKVNCKDFGLSRVASDRTTGSCAEPPVAGGSVAESVDISIVSGD